MSEIESGRTYIFDRGRKLSRAERRNLVIRGPLKKFSWRALEREEATTSRTIRVLLPAGPHRKVA